MVITNVLGIAVIAFAIMMVGGLVAIPVIEEEQAADDKNKGKQGEIKSDGKRKGKGGGGDGGTCR